MSETIDRQPTMAEPEVGAVYVVVNDRQIEIAVAEYWADHDGFTVRSREFDCFATGESLGQAMENFGGAVFEYAAAVERRIDEGTATESEQEAMRVLADRLSRIFLEERREQQSRRRLLRRRGPRDDDREWGAVPA
jgi:hypothetical protein